MASPRLTRLLLLSLSLGLVSVSWGWSSTPEEPSGNLKLAQAINLNNWRPYNNPNRLVSVGMNKGEVLAIAGKPDYEESYYQSGGGRLTLISDWYYIRTGGNAETTLLKFAQASLVSITATSTR